MNHNGKGELNNRSHKFHKKKLCSVQCRSLTTSPWGGGRAALVPWLVCRDELPSGPTRRPSVDFQLVAQHTAHYLPMHNCRCPLEKLQFKHGERRKSKETSPKHHSWSLDLNHLRRAAGAAPVPWLVCKDDLPSGTTRPPSVDFQLVDVHTAHCVQPLRNCRWPLEKIRPGGLAV